jgi:G3E family GTPase
MDNNKINTFIVTGFLGAGKTTYLNRILPFFKEENNVVIENEFGKVNIDKDLITDHYNTLFDLTNGCICCTNEGELLNTISQIGFTGKRPDNLVVECTGVADVNKVTSTFKIGDFDEVYLLRPVVCVVDCNVVLDFINKAIETSLQIVGSDWILLNRHESISTSQLEDIKQVITSINPFCKFLTLEEINKELLLETTHNENINLTPIAINIDNPHKIKQYLFESDLPANMDMLRQVFTSLMYFYTDTFYRIKGFVIAEDGLNYELQLASGSFKITPTNVKKVATQIVFIGKELVNSSIDRLMRPIFKNQNEN